MTEVSPGEPPETHTGRPGQMTPDHILRELASIPLDEPLPARLTRAVDALRAHPERMSAMGGTPFTSGHRRRLTPGGRPAPGDGETSMKATRRAVSALIEPDRAALRLEPGKISAVLLGMLFTPHLSRPGDTEPSPEELVGILLHGALNDPWSTP
ncbi:hypothetical protein [Streptosporangium sp. NPDC000396]|uniref:hypothetical protein n=1 Tax=Streptosporangium sp. NPDC000396 TaxID=3366185 RepID=UPI0036A812D5